MSVAELETPLSKEFERQGTWLFRWRSYVPFPLLLFLIGWVYLFPSANENPLLHLGWQAFCLGVGLVGIAVRAWVVGSVPTRTSGRNTRRQKASRLNTSGPYSLVRHPLYVGNFLLWIGIGAFCQSILLVLITLGYFWIVYERIMVTEERFLLSSFGEEYRKWASVTPAVIPDFSHWMAQSLPFSWQVAVRREYAALYGLVSVLFVLDLVEGTAISGWPYIDPLWMPLMAGTTVLYLLIRFLRRRTSLFDVPER